MSAFCHSGARHWPGRAEPGTQRANSGSERTARALRALARLQRKDGVHQPARAHMLVRRRRSQQRNFSECAREFPECGTNRLLKAVEDPTMRHIPPPAACGIHPHFGVSRFRPRGFRRLRVCVAAIAQRQQMADPEPTSLPHSGRVIELSVGGHVCTPHCGIRAVLPRPDPGSAEACRCAKQRTCQMTQAVALGEHWPRLPGMRWESSGPEELPGSRRAHELGGLRRWGLP